MTLADLIDEALDSQPLRFPSPAAAEHVVTARVASALGLFIKHLAEAVEGVAFEIDVDGQYDSTEHQVEIEMSVAMQYPSRAYGVDASMVLISNGFDYIVEYDLFRLVLVLPLERL